MDTVLITGGTGLIGHALTQLLTDHGYKVIILSRQQHPAPSVNSQVTYARWDIHRQTLDATALQEADYIVHLAGANVGTRRWTDARKQEILESRTHSSQLLFNALQQYPNKVKKFIGASAIGYYGPDEGRDRPFTEGDEAATGFLGTTCTAWENSVLQIGNLDKKVVILRTGFAMSRKGGALQQFHKPLKFGFATVLGSGEQWVSWIHIHDLVRLYFNAIVNPTLEGIFNAVAPHPAPNRELIEAMANSAKGGSFISVHVPAFALKLAFGEMSTEVLKSCRVSSQKIQDKGFVFSYPTIQAAMEQLYLKK